MRKLTMFATGFVLMLVAGGAAAQMGFLASVSDTVGEEVPMAQPAADIPREGSPDEAEDLVAPKEYDRPSQFDGSKAAAKTDEVDQDAEAESGTSGESDQADEQMEKLFVSVTYPLDGDVVQTPELKFKGTTLPGARVFAGPYEATVGEDGTWYIVLILSTGSNRATFTAVDREGMEASTSVKVIYESPKEEAPKEGQKPKSDIEFTANQKFGETAEGYEKFWGTGAPGTKVEVWSDHGSTTTEVSKTGEWWAKLLFDAPAGTTFSVTVSDSNGNAKVLEVKVLERSFSAFQKYGSCSEDPAYDVFYGQGEPGTEVQIFSDYGSGSTIIGEDGNWKLKVFFETAPFNETFKVTVEAEEVKKTFEFTRLQDK